MVFENIFFYNVFRNIFYERRFAYLKGACCTMNENNKLLSYIYTLTPEQIEKLVNQLPRLISLLQAKDQPCQPEQILKTPQAS